MFVDPWDLDIVCYHRITSKMGTIYGWSSWHLSFPPFLFIVLWSAGPDWDHASWKPMLPVTSSKKTKKHRLLTGAIRFLLAGFQLLNLATSCLNQGQLGASFQGGRTEAYHILQSSFQNNKSDQWFWFSSGYSCLPLNVKNLEKERCLCNTPTLGTREV